MNCTVLQNEGAYVTADSPDAAQRINDMAQADLPVTFVMKRPAPEDTIRMASYNARNTLHLFVNVADPSWAASTLALADRCGVRSAVTLYPLIPGGTPCADVLEIVASLAVSYKVLFLLMFPRIMLPVEKTDSGWMVGGREVDERFVTALGGGFFPSHEYVCRVMKKMHKYLDCTPHGCGMCGKDCRLCQAGKSA